MRVVSIRKVVFAAVPTALFAALQILATQLTAPGDDHAIGMSWLGVFLAVLIVAIASWTLLSVLDRQAESARMRPGVSATMLIVSGLLMAAGWTLEYLAFWPMASMNDTHWILNHPLEAAIQHPLAYNLWLALPYRLGRDLLGNELTGIVIAAVVQMLLWLFALLLLLRYLQRVGISRTAYWILTAYFALSPLLADYTFALVKDSFFAVFVVLLIPILLTVRETRGSSLRKWPFFALAVLTLAGFAVARNNGLVVMVGVAAIMIAYSRNARGLATAAAGIALGMSIVPTMITSNITGPQQFKEAVGVPLQQIGYTARTNPNCIPETSSAYFSEILPMDRWADQYRPTIADSIKDAEGFNSQYLTDTKGRFLAEWGNTVMNCPGEFVRAYLIHTSPLWNVQGAIVRNSSQSYFDSPVSNNPANKEGLIQDYASRGIVSQPLVPSWLEATYRAGIYYTPANSIWIWASAFAISAFLYRRRSEWFPIFAPTLLVVATLLIAAPTASPFRYVAPLLVVVPTAFAVLLGTRSLEPKQLEKPKHRKAPKG